MYAEGKTISLKRFWKWYWRGVTSQYSSTCSAIEKHDWTWFFPYKVVGDKYLHTPKCEYSIAVLLCASRSVWIKREKAINVNPNKNKRAVKRMGLQKGLYLYAPILWELPALKQWLCSGASLCSMCHPCSVMCLCSNTQYSYKVPASLDTCWRVLFYIVAICKNLFPLLFLFLKNKKTAMQVYWSTWKRSVVFYADVAIKLSCWVRPQTHQCHLDKVLGNFLFWELQNQNYLLWYNNVIWNCKQNSWLYFI